MKPPIPLFDGYSMPATLRLAIVTPAEGEWKPPSHRILPEVLDKGLKHVEKFLEPATDAQIASAIMALAMSLEFRGKPQFIGKAEEQAFYGRVVGDLVRSLRGAPNDIVRDACDAHAKSSSIFPTVAEIGAIVEPMLTKRRADLARTRYLIEWQCRPHVEPAFQPEPRDVICRATIARWRKFEGHFMASNLRESAVRAELELAEIEQRAPEDWAQEQSTKPQPSRPQPKPSTIEGEWERVEAPEVDQ